jgi:hypothetical protein
VLPDASGAIFDGFVGCVRLRVGQTNDLENSVWMDWGTNDWPTETLHALYDRPTPILEVRSTDNFDF